MTPGAARADVQRPADPGELVRCRRAHRHPAERASAFREALDGGRDRADRAVGGRPVRTRATPVSFATCRRRASAGGLRVLFFAGGPRFYLRQFSSLVAELAARGHEVQLAFQPLEGRACRSSDAGSPA